MKFVKCIVLLMMSAVLLWGRSFTILEFRELQSDFKAQTAPELDMDMNYCSVLRVESTRAVEISLKEKTYRTEKIGPGKFYFYFSSREKFLTLQSHSYESLTIEPPERGFKPGVVYFLRVDTRDDVDVSIRVNPQDAKIRVDGELWTQNNGKLTPGNHDLEITLDGYEPIHETLQIENRPAVFNYTMTPETTVPEIQSPAAVPAAQSKSVSTVTAYDFSFDLLSCKRMPDDKVIIKIRITNLSPDDKELAIHRNSRFYDDQGREFGSPVRTMGNKKATYHNILVHQMISRIPTLLTLTFSDVPRSSRSISLLELTTKEWTLPFRGIPIE
ncbi:MAG: hypothetical protein J7K63_06865 [Candidatus Marinimicrobia bacterium]|nr:hypothetical protein [Candidatus Neomarinimicrobiota bacterium]